ncbi:MAG: hypothetical protein IJE08_15085 [Clostridia bacterium]|nr:hypothetical protein [Clostridia bacterium]
MKNRNWQNVFGRAPEYFLDQVDEALDRLKEERDVKRRYRYSLALAAAVLAVVMTGAAIAAGMGLIDRINESGGYKMGQEAEELIARDLGGMENELFSVVIEEAIYDGQSAVMQILLAPKEPEKYALYHADYTMPEELYENFIFDAQEGQDSRMPVACRDGRKALLYDVGVNQVRGDEMAWDNRPDYLAAPQYREDGSVRLLIGGTADIPIRKDSIYFAVTCRWGVAGEYEYTGYQSEGAPYLPHFEDVRVEIENTDGRAKFILEPAGETSNGRMEFVAGTIEYTAIGGYYDVEYVYSGEDAWLNEFGWESEGEELFANLVNIHGEDGVFEESGGTVRVRGMIERTEEIPGTLTLILLRRGEEQEFGRIGLNVIPAE